MTSAPHKTGKKTSPKSKRASSKSSDQNPNKLTLFDHVKHIRGVQDPDYYTNLSEENKKTFNVFMIIRALAMDSDIVQVMAQLYRVFNLIPPAQFYILLINIVPRNNRWVPWIKTKVVKHSPELLTLMADHFKVSKKQANEYVNVLLASTSGLETLVEICQSNGLNDKEVEKLFDKKDA